MKACTCAIFRRSPLCSVRTRNSLYRVVIVQELEVYVHGGHFFPDPTWAYLVGASIEGSGLEIGWIGIGLPMEIRLGRRRIITSPVRAVTTTEQMLSSSIVSP